MTTAVRHPPMIGPEYQCLASYVPDEIEEAVGRYEHAREMHALAYRSYADSSDRCLPDRDMRCRVSEEWRDRMVDAWVVLEALIPTDPGWYPSHGWVWGWAKRHSNRPLELCREPAWYKPGNVEARDRWRRGVEKRALADRIAERQLAALDSLISAKQH
jgi:hypothetical protein